MPLDAAGDGERETPMDTISETLAAFTSDLAFSDLPDEVVAKVRLHTLDILGVCLLSSRLPVAPRLQRLAGRVAGRAGQCTVVGSAGLLSPPGAAFVNGALAHSAEFDDTYAPGRWHGSAPVIPVALAVAEDVGASGPELITAIAAGLEIGCRLTRAAPGVLYRGFHSTCTAGIFGGAAAAGRLLGAGTSEVSRALAIAGAFASGTAEFLEDDDPWIKGLQVGHAAHDAVASSIAAAEGLVGPRTILEGKYGYFAAHAGEGNYDLDSIADGLGQQWELLRLYPKRYPCDHLAQGYVQCVIDLATEHDIEPAAVEELCCVVHPLVVPVMFEPQELRYRPPNAWSARWSMPFNLAVALTDARLTVRSYDDARTADPAIRSLMDRVSYTTDASLNFPIDYPAMIRARLVSGEELTLSALKVKGTPENPMTATEYEVKFRENAADTLGSGCDRAIEQLRNLTDLENVGELLATFRVDS